MNASGTQEPPGQVASRPATPAGMTLDGTQCAAPTVQQVGSDAGSTAGRLGPQAPPAPPVPPVPPVPPPRPAPPSGGQVASPTEQPAIETQSALPKSRLIGPPSKGRFFKPRASRRGCKAAALAAHQGVRSRSPGLELECGPPVGSADPLLTLPFRWGPWSPVILSNFILLGWPGPCWKAALQDGGAGTRYHRTREHRSAAAARRLDHPHQGPGPARATPSAPGRVGRAGLRSHGVVGGGPVARAGLLPVRRSAGDGGRAGQRSRAG